jgi:MFS family permease
MNTRDRIWNRNFTLLWQGNLVSLLGTQAYLIGLTLWVKEATGSEAWVGTMMMIGAAANFLSPIGGAMADHFSRVRMLVILDLLAGITVTGLAVLFFVQPDSTDLLLGALIAASAVLGLISAVFNPTILALTPDVSPPDRLNASRSQC